MRWDEAIEQSQEKFAYLENQEGETIGIINQHVTDSSALVTGDKDILAPNKAGVDLALQELCLPREGWQPL